MRGWKTYDVTFKWGHFEVLVPYEGLEEITNDAQDQVAKQCWSPMRGWKLCDLPSLTDDFQVLVPYEGLEAVSWSTVMRVMPGVGPL